MGGAVSWRMLWVAGFVGCVIPRAYAPPVPPSVAFDPPGPPPMEPGPRGIVLMIGDGMGVSQLTSAIVAQGGVSHMERAPVVGLQKTWSADALVTDSAASATAMATGVKTHNGMVGVSPTGAELESILHWAESQGLATGIVCTSRVTHATPAAFVAHEPDRGDEEAIALDFLDVGLDLVIGGGRDRFTDRADGRDLLEELSAAGVRVVGDLADVAGDGPVYALLEDGPLPSVRKGRGDLLPRATAAALAQLSGDPEGFFLLVEGSQVDWGGHLNHTPWLVTEAVDFDASVGVALDFAEAAADVLVVVTADHETGGLALKGGDLQTGEVVGRYTSHRHTAAMVPVLASGPMAETFAGIYDNVGIHERLFAALPMRSSR
ncbi:MAG: alkaline phosphatase [Myxococcales bacterium]|nr:alkaline phosphatase [Myxococcales bacterium]